MIRTHVGMRRVVASALSMLLLGLVALVQPPAAGAVTTVCPGAPLGAPKVLILDTTVSGGCSSVEATTALAQGMTPEIVDAAEWSSKTTADFAAYRAIVLGDANCSGGTEQVAAAEANAMTWSPAVTGNVVVIGTDESLHTGAGRGEVLTDKSLAFATADAAKTGALISLSCYYHYFFPGGGAPAGTPVPVLAGFGAFTTQDAGDCFNDVHIVATHPALDGLTDATLSNWSCSAHEVFDSWPVGFEVLAIAQGFGSVYTATDGTVGTPYILARGVTVISDITLSPESAENPLGSQHELTATVAEDDDPVVGTTVTFEVVSGPNTGVLGTAVTDGSGVATLSYTSTLAGVDTIQATFVDSTGATQRSNRVTKTWVAVEVCGNGIDDDGDDLVDEGCNQPPDCSTASAGPSLWPPNHKMVPVTISGVTDPDGNPVTIMVTSIRQDEPTNTVGDGTTEVDGSGVGTSTASVRAERVGTPKVPGNGRVYHIGFTASDGAGGTCTGVVLVGVPHDQGKSSVPVDGGPLYDSTSP